MTLLEYVTSLQDTGLSQEEIFAKAQEFKGRTKTEEVEVVETPVEEVKVNDVADQTDATVASTNKASEKPFSDAIYGSGESQYQEVDFNKIHENVFGKSIEESEKEEKQYKQDQVEDILGKYDIGSDERTIAYKQLDLAPDDTINKDLYEAYDSYVEDREKLIEKVEEVQEGDSYGIQGLPKVDFSKVGEALGKDTKDYNNFVASVENLDQVSDYIGKIQKEKIEPKPMTTVDRAAGAFLVNLPLGLENAWETSKAATMDWVSAVAGDDVADWMVGEGSSKGIVWIDPETNEEVDFNTDPQKWKELNTRNMGLEDIKSKYKDTGVEVGEAAENYIINQFKKSEALNRARVDVGTFVKEFDITKPFETKFASGDELIGGIFDTIGGFVSTAIPAALTRGASMMPQIAAPMYVDYNIEKAKNLYGDSPDSIGKLIRSGETELTTPLVLGGIAAGLEYVGFKGVAKNLIGKTGIMKPVVSMTLTQNKEGLTELGQLGTETLNKGLGSGKSISDSMIDALKTMTSKEGVNSYLMGFAGSGIITAPSTIRKALITETEVFNSAAKHINTIASLQLQRSQNKNKDFRKAIDIQIQETESSLKDLLENTNKLANKMTKEEQSEVLNLLNEKSKNTKTLEGLNNSFKMGELTAQQYGSAKGALVNKNKKLSSETSRILAEANTRLIEAEVETVKKFAGEDKVKVYNTTKEFVEATGKDPDFDAFIEPDTGEIFINKERAAKVGSVTAGSHELLHKIIKQSFSDPETAARLVEDFKSILSTKELAVVQKRIDENYSDQSSEVQNEEFLTSFSDAIGTGELTWSDNLKETFMRLAKPILNIFRGKGYSNLEFESGRDVYDFIKDYQKNIKKGKISERAELLSATGEVDMGLETEVDLGDVKASKRVETQEQADRNKELVQKAKDGDITASRDLVQENSGLILRLLGFNKDIGDVDADSLLQAVTDMATPGMADLVFPGRKQSLVEEYKESSGEVSTFLGRLKQRKQEIYKAAGLDASKFDTESLSTPEARQIAADETAAAKPIKETSTKQIDATSFGPAKNKKQDLENIVQVKDVDRPNFKSLNNKYFNDAAESLFGISGKKVRGNASLKYGGTKTDPTSSEANTLQNVFKNSENVRSFIKTMPKYNVATKETIINKQGESIDVSRDTYGRALGINPKVIEVFYDKVTTAIPGVSSAKGRSLGKTTQPPVYKIKPEFDAEVGPIGKEAIIKLQSLIGITPSGELSIPVKGPARTEFGSALTGLSKMYVDNVINTIGRSKLDSKQAKADLGAGKSKAMASKRIANVFQKITDDVDSIGFNAYEINYNKTLDDLLKDTGVDRINMNTPEGRKRFLDFAIDSGLTTKLPPKFWIGMGFLSENLLKDNTVTFSEAVANSKKEIEALREDPDVLPFEQEKPFRGYKGYLPFRNSTEARQWISETKAKGISFAKETEAYKDMFRQEDPFLKKSPLETALNNKEFIKRQDNSINQLKNIFELFQNEVMRNSDGTMNFEGVAFVGALLSSSSASTGHFLRKAAPFRFYQKGYKEAGSSGTTIEHTMPATLVGKYLFVKALEGSVSENFKYIKDNYFQGALLKVDDNKLKGKKLNGDKFNYVATMPEGWQETDNVWARYFNINVGLTGGGINPNTIILKDNKSVYDIFNITSTGVKVDSKAKASRREANNLDNNLLPDAITYDKPVTTQALINALEKTDKSLELARKLDQPVKKIRVFDFDDTLARTKSNVLYTMPDGTTGKIDAATFAKEAGNMEAEGAQWDFSEFSKVMQGSKGPLLDVAKIIADKRGTKDVFVLTARPADAAGPIKEFLASMGLDIPLANITGLGDGAPQAKAGWIMGKAAEGYNDFYFADDHTGNVKAVKDVLSQIDVKSKVQLAKASKRTTFDTIVNDMIEDSSGIETYKKYSAARAKTVGASKGKYNFLIPPSAEDFTGLLYKMIGKGKKGDAQMAFLKTNLLDTYNRAESAVTQAKISAANDFVALKTQLKTLPKTLSKQTGIGKFTYSHAVRVAAWTRQGMTVPGLSKRDVKELNDFVKNDSKLNEFTNELIVIQKGKEYPKPGKDWLGGNITTDIIGGINKVNRAEYQQEWRENIEIIFSEDNMNKMEAAYGTRWREAMEDSIRRMKSGSNRPIGGNRVTEGLLNWLNNSVGAVMFLNTRSALLQTISAVNFINLGDNNIIKAGRAFANQKQFWGDFMTLMNSDYLVERRNGLKINVSESEIADAVRESKNKPRAAIAFLLSKGFVLTRFADSFAIATGGSTFYRNRLEALKKQGLSDADAKTQAFEDFKAIAEENQQSSSPSKISQQQASAAGRVILAWANTPMQYARIQKRAAQDLINKRGDWKSNVSKIVYYGAIQNLIFNALQQAVFALGFGDDEEETDEAKAKKRNDKAYKVVNGMIDSQLKGLGIFGSASAAIKNTLMTLYEEHGKKGSKYEKAIADLESFSPPLGSKISKIRGGLRSASWNKKDMKEKGFSLDNPAYMAGAQVVTGLTNIPLDRVVKKINNLRGLVNERSSLWQKVALGLGWGTWELGLGYYGGWDKKEPLTPKQELQLEVDKMKKDTSKPDQVKTLLDFGLTKKQIRELKNENNRVKKILELQKKDKNEK